MFFLRLLVVLVYLIVLVYFVLKGQIPVYCLVSYRTKKVIHHVDEAITLFPKCLLLILMVLLYLFVIVYKKFVLLYLMGVSVSGVNTRFICKNSLQVLVLFVLKSQP